MGWLGLVLTFITNLPKIISLVKAILDLIHNLEDPAQRSDAFDRLSVAYKNKDVASLQKLHDELCNGVACPPDLKKG